MAKWCPILQETVVYMYCEDCEETVCRTHGRHIAAQQSAQAETGQPQKRQATESVTGAELSVLGAGMAGNVKNH